MQTSFLHNLSPIRDILTKTRYAVLALSIAGFLMLASFALIIRSFLFFVIKFPVNHVWERINLLSESPQALALNASTTQLVSIVVISLLAGIHGALVTYYYRERARLTRSSSVGMIGIISAIIGIGCGSCGSILLTALIGFSASTSLIALLPLHGLEFSVLAIVLLSGAIVYLSSKISRGSVTTCTVSS